MSEEPKFKYGVSHDLFVTRKPGGEALVVGGVGEDAARWTRVLSNRAAHVLWFHLTQFLYPDKSDRVRASVMTVPFRDSTFPTVTTHMSVEETSDKGYEIVGWAGNHPVWRAQLNPDEARRFLTALDSALYPLGMQGKGADTPQ